MILRTTRKTKTISVVFIDEVGWGILANKVLQRLGISIENETNLPESQSERLLEELNNYAWNRFLKFLTYRERSLWECQQYLKELPLHKNIADKLIALANKYNYISDDRFAEILVRSMCEYGKSKRQIICKLKEKRIADNLMEKYIQEYYLDQEQSILAQNTQKALARYSRLPQKAQIEKVKTYLYQKGFSYSDIMNTLIKLEKNHE